MKILHLSENTLPDMRIEKYALLQQENQVFYAGGSQVDDLYTGYTIDKLFTDFYEVPTNRPIRLGLPIFFGRWVKKIGKVITEIEPDIIHAHNIFTAKACYDLNVDYIYDDHEFWKYQAKARLARPKGLFDKNRITDRVFNRFINKWEKEIIRNATAVIGVSSTLTNALKDYANDTSEKYYTISNFPSKQEINQLKQIDHTRADDELKIILVAKAGGILFEQSTQRIVDALQDSPYKLTLLGDQNKVDLNPKVKYPGYVPHHVFLEYLLKHHIGLTQFAKNDFPEYYQYISPNRLFFYVHCGLTPVIKNEMTYLRELFGDYALVVNNESEIFPTIQDQNLSISEWNKRAEKIMDFARNNLVFDQQKEIIEFAYNSQLK